MTVGTALELDATLLSPTVTGVAGGLSVPASVTIAFWEEMTPTSVCDSFFAPTEVEEPSLQEAGSGFWS